MTIFHNNKDTSTDDTNLIDNRSQKDKVEDNALQEIIKKSGKQTDQLKINVSSPFNIYYDDVAISLSAKNLSGDFDILPGHHNFICLLLPCTVAIRTTNNQIQNIDITGGLLHVKKNIVQLFLDI